MRHSATQLLLVLACLITVSSATTHIAKSQIDFHCEILSSSECMTIANLGENIEVDAELINAGIANILTQIASLGYPTAGVDSVITRHDNGNEHVDIYISIGHPLLVNSIYYSETATTDIQHDYDTKSNLVSNNYLRNKAYKLLDTYADNGFPFASVNIVPSNISNENNDLSTNLNLHTQIGDFIRIGSVNFPGRAVTSLILLRNESRIRRGAIFNQTYINRALAKLNKLDYIDQSESIILIPSSPGIVDINIPITENKITTFSGIAAYDQQDDKIRGDVNLSLGNILGTGRKLELVWEGLDRLRSGVSLAYYEPWLMGHPLHASIGINLWTGDSLGVRFDRYFGLDWQPNFNITVGSEVKFENINLPEVNSIRKGYNSVWVSVKGSIDYLDRLWNPKRGIYLSSMSSTGFRKAVGANSESRVIHHDKVSLRYVRKLHNKLYISQFSKIDDIRGENVTNADLIPIGGINSLRGYVEGRNIVRGVYINNIELRWRFDDGAYFGIFNDLGWIYRQDSNNPVDKLLTTIGLTTGIYSNSTRININIGLAAGEPMQNARLHVRIRRYF